MAYPDLEREESIILETRNIKFKSILFDAILTYRRIILFDRKKDDIPSQEISLGTILNVETGENAIRDNFLILTVMTETDGKHDIVLTFLRQSGGERKRECNEWAKNLISFIPSTFSEAPPVEIPVPDESPLPLRGSTIPAPFNSTITRPEKKKIEIARPLGKIREDKPVSPVPVETSSLPSGTFCSRCGNRVPFESLFCNHCGIPITHKPVNGAAQKSVVPQVQIPVPPSVGSLSERQGRPIEQIIHSIEPLIEDSVPRTYPSPLFQKQPSQPPAESAPPEQQPVQTPAVIWPVLQKTEAPASGPNESASSEPGGFPPPLSSQPPPLKQPNYLAIGIIALAILAVIGGLLVVANLLPGPGGVPGVTTTIPVTNTVVITTALPTQTSPPTVITTIPEPTPTQILIPQTGVWVRALYNGTYIGLIGTPGNQIEVTDTGDHFYQVSTIDGTVAAVLQKKDGSADKIVLEVYKNGVMVRRESTGTPKGIVEVQVDLKTVPAVNGSSIS